MDKNSSTQKSDLDQALIFELFDRLATLGKRIRTHNASHGIKTNTGNSRSNIFQEHKR